MQLAKDRAKDNDLGGAEGYRTMAESIHETSKTFECWLNEQNLSAC